MKILQLLESHYTDPDQIAEWIFDHHIIKKEELLSTPNAHKYDNSEFTIDLQTGEVTFHEDLDLCSHDNAKLTVIPIKIKSIKSFMDVSYNSLSTFENFPHQIGVEKHVMTSSLRLTNNKYRTYRNAHKHFQYLHQCNVILDPADCMLSWMHVKGVRRITTPNSRDIGDIMTNFLPSRDIIGASEALEKAAAAGRIKITDGMLDL